MDIAEQSERQEQLARDIAIKIRRAAVEQGRRDYCIDCGGLIPVERVSVRCVPCKTKIEKRLTRR